MNTLGFVAVERFTDEKRFLIVKTFDQNHESAAAIARRLRTIFGRKEVPTSRTAVQRLTKKFETTGYVSSGQNRTQRNAQQVAIVKQNVVKSPRKSIRTHSQQMSIPQGSLQRILIPCINKIQLTQQVTPVTLVQEKFPN